jgi:ornithine--oxo-acid transaminase
MRQLDLKQLTHLLRRGAADGLSSIRANTIREVRGRGLMLAVELHPEAGGARRYCEALQSRGILAKDTHEHMIRVAPPLVIVRRQII